MLPTTSTNRRPPTSEAPVTFFHIVQESYAQQHLVQMVEMQDMIMARLEEHSPGFFYLIMDPNVDMVKKAKRFANVINALSVRRTPGDFIAAASAPDLDREVETGTKTVITALPPLADLRPAEEAHKPTRMDQRGLLYGYIFDQKQSLFRKSRLLPLVISVTSPRATASLLTLTATADEMVKNLFPTNGKNRDPWYSALRYSVLQITMFILDIDDGRDVPVLRRGNQDLSSEPDHH